MSKFQESTERHYEPISKWTLGTDPLILQEDLEEILLKLKIELLETTCARKFLHCLNTEVERTLREQFEVRLDPKKVKMLRNRYKSFMSLTRELEQSEFPPPPVSKQWEKNFEEWLEALPQFFERRKKGGPRELVLSSYFYPRAVALLVAGTGIVPTDQVLWEFKDSDAKDGTVARFIFHVTRKVREGIELRGIDCHEHNLSLVKVVWDDPKDDTFKARLSKSLNQEIEFEEWLPTKSINRRTGELSPSVRKGHGKTWLIFANQFQSEIRCDCANDKLTGS